MHIVSLAERKQTICLLEYNVISYEFRKSNIYFQNKYSIKENKISFKQIILVVNYLY